MYLYNNFESLIEIKKLLLFYCVHHFFGKKVKRFPM